MWPFLVYFVAVVLLVATMLGLSWVLGQRRANQATNIPYESGILPQGTTQGKVSVEFYLVAIFFVIFDLEAIIIFAWAVAFRDLGWPGLISVTVFILILLAALVYGLSTGTLNWGNKTRTPGPSREQSG